MARNLCLWLIILDISEFGISTPKKKQKTKSSAFVSKGKIYKNSEQLLNSKLIIIFTFSCPSVQACRNRNKKENFFWQFSSYTWCGGFYKLWQVPSNLLFRIPNSEYFSASRMGLIHSHMAHFNSFSKTPLVKSFTFKTGLYWTNQSLNYNFF